MSVPKMIEYICSKQKSLRIERWNNLLQVGHGAWRVGINWQSEEKYELLVEKIKLRDALKIVVSYLEGKIKV